MAVCWVHRAQSSRILRWYSSAIAFFTRHSSVATAFVAQTSESFMSDVHLSRAPNQDRQLVEVRPMVPVEVVAVIDAVCCNENGKDRTRKVNEILRAWAVLEARRATVIVNVLRGNPLLVEPDTEAAP